MPDVIPTLPAVAVVGDGESPIPDEKSHALSPYAKTLLESRRIGLSRVFVAAFILSIVVVRSRWPAPGLMSGVLLVLGIFLSLTGCLGRIWCSLFISGMKTKELVVVGPYSACRNPLYLFSAIGALGVGLGSGMFIIPGAAAICSVVYYAAIVRAEERRLLEIHGDRFREYCRQTPCFLPNLRQFVLPDTYQITPRLVLRTMIESTAFVWLTLITHAIYLLHQRTNMLPTLWQSF